MINAQLSILQIACTIMLASFAAYLGGRVHQWRRQDNERNTAFREGFLRASEGFMRLPAGGSRLPTGSPVPVNRGVLPMTRVIARGDR